MTTLYIMKCNSLNHVKKVDKTHLWYCLGKLYSDISPRMRRVLAGKNGRWLSWK